LRPRYVTNYFNNSSFHQIYLIQETIALAKRARVVKPRAATKPKAAVKPKTIQPTIQPKDQAVKPSSDVSYPGNNEYMNVSRYHPIPIKPMPVDDGKKFELLDKLVSRNFDREQSMETANDRMLKAFENLQGNIIQLSTSKDALIMEMMKNMNSTFQLVTGKMSEDNRALNEGMTDRFVSMTTKLAEESRKSLEDSRNHDRSLHERMADRLVSINTKLSEDNKEMARDRAAENMNNNYLAAIVQLNAQKGPDQAFAISGPGHNFTVSKATG
jgi:23S rRNA pseudoU1915 N3-methylase RlmH